jgi:hypothetical protein
VCGIGLTVGVDAAKEPVLSADLLDESVTATAERFQITRRRRRIAENPAQFPYVRAQEAAGNLASCPYTIQEFVVGYESAWIADEVKQNLERLAAHLD